MLIMNYNYMVWRGTVVIIKNKVFEAYGNPNYPGSICQDSLTITTNVPLSLIDSGFTCPSLNLVVKYVHQ